MINGGFELKPDQKVFTTSRTSVAAWLMLMGHPMTEIKVVQRADQPGHIRKSAVFVFPIDDLDRFGRTLEQYETSGIVELVNIEKNLRNQMHTKLAEVNPGRQLYHQVKGTTLDPV